MHTNHIDKHIEAYLDNHLSPKTRQMVELHIKQCPTCARRLAEASWLNKELGPTMQAVFGQPKPPGSLRYKTQAALNQTISKRPFYVNWAVPARVFNAAGTAAVVVLLAFGSYTVIRGQLSGINLISPSAITIASNQGGGDTPTPTPTAIATVQPAAATPATAPHQSSTSDTLPQAAIKKNSKNVDTRTAETTENNQQIAPILQPAIVPDKTFAAPLPNTQPLPPAGTIAFSLFNGTQYQLHLINPDGSNLRKLLAQGASEPALHPTNNETPLAYRSWSDPQGPRSLVSSDIQIDQPKSVSDFWEDAQADWSPTENRIIFASQRESDRNWRLYTVWGNGLEEKNLRREGKSPTFAPDGYRFAFESCDEIGNHCGLWVGDLEHSEYESKPILENPQAKSPDWSPVSDEIVYMAKSGSNWDLYTVNSNGDTPRKLLSSPANEGLPVWSPDGEWVAFVSDKGGQWGIWRLHINSEELHQITTFENGTLQSPQRLPYTQHGERNWWDEQISWGY